MAQGLEFDLKEIVLANSTFGPVEIDQISQAVNEDHLQFSELRDGVAELEVREGRTPATAVRLGVCYYLLGNYSEAIETLRNADGGAVTHFYIARSMLEMAEYDEAITSYDSAKTAGYNSDYCTLGVVEAMRGAGRNDDAMKTLDGLYGPIEHEAEYLYQRGSTVAALGGNPNEVLTWFERAVEANQNHPGALFGLAMENDRRGNDHEALELYQLAVGCFPSHVGALLNLGILYEDRQQYERAMQCYQRILDVFPDHGRARLFLKDAMASGDMYVDEEAQKRSDRMAQVLNIPVTDFELSVRSRNCLQKMGVRTLGDLTRTSELELLTSKNFGETSLVEIRDMLQSRGLELGQFAHEKSEPEAPYDVSSMTPDEQALLDRPIADLNLSVRARKCMVRLGLTTIGELVRRTGDDLLECKNFGVTSLTEVREKLGPLEIKLRGD